MDIYTKLTCLNGSDRYALIRYGSEFYEFSPETVADRRISENSNNMYGENNNTARKFIINNK